MSLALSLNITLLSGLRDGLGSPGHLYLFLSLIWPLLNSPLSLVLASFVSLIGILRMGGRTQLVRAARVQNCTLKFPLILRYSRIFSPEFPSWLKTLGRAYDQVVSRCGCWLEHGWTMDCGLWRTVMYGLCLDTALTVSLRFQSITEISQPCLSFS